MSEAAVKLEEKYRQHYTDESLKERVRPTPPDSVPSEFAILAAINETNYKYFGDYEFGEDQSRAVQVLVQAALALIHKHPTRDSATATGEK